MGADALNSISKAEKRGKLQVLLRPASKVIVKFLGVMMKHGYIGEFEQIDDHRSGKIVVNLTGRLNKCGVVSPRFDVSIRDMEKWTTNLLPSRQFGFVVLTTFGWKNSWVFLSANSHRVYTAFDPATGFGQKQPCRICNSLVRFNFDTANAGELASSHTPCTESLLPCEPQNE